MPQQPETGRQSRETQGPLPPYQGTAFGDPGASQGRSWAIVLPWPGSALSPNGRTHWRVLAKAKARYRQQCAEHARTTGGLPSVPAGAVVALEMVFHPPTRRGYDLDNLHARMKSGLDGLCDALGVNDRQFRPVLVDMGTKHLGGMVVASLRW